MPLVLLMQIQEHFLFPLQAFACMYVKYMKLLTEFSLSLFVHYMYLSNIQVKFMIVPLVLLIDPGVVSEVEHSEPPSQKRKSDDGSPQ